MWCAEGGDTAPMNLSALPAGFPLLDAWRLRRIERAVRSGDVLALRRALAACGAAAHVYLDDAAWLHRGGGSALMCALVPRVDGPKGLRGRTIRAGNHGGLAPVH